MDLKESERRRLGGSGARCARAHVSSDAWARDPSCLHFFGSNCVYSGRVDVGNKKKGGLALQRRSSVQIERKEKEGLSKQGDYSNVFVRAPRGPARAGARSCGVFFQRAPVRFWFWLGGSLSEQKRESQKRKRRRKRVLESKKLGGRRRRRSSGACFSAQSACPPR